MDNDLPAKLKALKTAGIIDQHALDAYAQAIRKLSPAQRNAFAKQTQIIRTTQAQLSRRGLRDYLEEPKTNTL